MGSQSSRPPSEVDRTHAVAPALAPAAVERLCQEAYAAGAEDAGIHYMQLVDSTRRQDLAVGALACLATLWLTMTYGTTRVAREKAFAEEHLEAQKELLVVAHDELARAHSQVKELMASLETRDALIARQRRELVRMAKARRAAAIGMLRVKQQSAQIQKDMAALQVALAAMRSGLAAGGCALALLWLGTTWCVVRRRRQEPNGDTQA